MSRKSTSHPRRRTVLSRVLLSYVLITFSFALVTGYSVFGQRQSARETELMRSGYMPLALALRDAVSVQNTYNSQLNHITDAKNPADKRVWFETTLSLGRPKVFAEIHSALRQAFEARERSLGEQLSTETEEVERLLEADREILSQLFQAVRENDEARARTLRDQLVTRGTQALSMLRTLEDRVNAQLDALLDEAAERERRTLQVLLAWAAFAVLFGAGVALYARRLLRPLVAVTERAKAVARGDMTPHAVSSSNDEIGELARTFESMVAAIARANQELLESERLATIGKMAAQVTHEVRNPLSSIALNLELLEEELKEDNPEARSLHRAIKREVERLTELTEQYLSVARRNDPRFVLEDIGGVVSEAAAFVQPDLERHRVELVIDIEPDLPEVWVDEAQIRQVIHNLARNARQAMPQGGSVTLAVARSKTGVQISVADTGSGIEPAVRERLFEPFFTTRGGGTGLGLAISRHIVETHHGTIRCLERDGGGTVFAIELPLDPRDVPRREQTSMLDA